MLFVSTTVDPLEGACTILTVNGESLRPVSLVSTLMLTAVNWSVVALSLLAMGVATPPPVPPPLIVPPSTITTYILLPLSFPESVTVPALNVFLYKYNVRSVVMRVSPVHSHVLSQEGLLISSSACPT